MSYFYHNKISATFNQNFKIGVGRGKTACIQINELHKT